MSEQVSKCCGAAVNTYRDELSNDPYHVMFWHECTKCLTPCGVEQPAASAGGGAAELQKEQRP